MKSKRAELHIHTVLSPDAGLEMIPPFIIEEAQKKGIEILAITDHNASANVPAVMRAAEGTGITVIPGLELETQEEVHILCLFDNLAQLNQFQTLVDQHLPPYLNNENFFGTQLVVDENGNFLRKDERLLAAASTLTLLEAKRAVQALGGWFLPAHVEREQNGLLPRLGDFPPELELEIVEISHYLRPQSVREQFPQLRRMRTIQNGDAHHLDGILGITELRIEKTDLDSIRRTLIA